MTLGRTGTERLPFITLRGDGYPVIGDAAVDTSGKHRYVTCDGGFCSPHNSGQTYTKNWSFLVTPLVNMFLSWLTNTYNILLITRLLGLFYRISLLWCTSRDTQITSDNKYVYLWEKSSSSSTTTNLVRFTISSKSSKTVFSTSYWVNDVAISATANSMSVSTTSNLLYTTNNAGTTWMNHTSV